MSDEHPGPRGPLAALASLAARLQTVAGVCGVLALGGAVVEGLVAGLTFAVILRWSAAYVAAVLLAAAVLVARTFRGPWAQRRGRHRSASDAGLGPPRRRSTGRHSAGRDSGGRFG